MNVNDCHEVVPLIESYIERLEADNDPVGYFAALYRLTSMKIVAGIDNKEFEDNERMSRMVVTFAGRYFDALAAHLDGGKATQAWTVAFEGAKDKRLTVIQHLFLGMNAHINLDLPVAAAQTCDGQDIMGFHNDFKKINKYLDSLLSIVTHDLERIAPAFKVFLEIGERVDNLILSFGMALERKAAWRKAVKLSKLAPEERDPAIGEMDGRTAHLANDILHPGKVAELVLKFVRMKEEGTVSERIKWFEESPE